MKAADLGLLRAHLASAHRALDDLHLVAEDALSPEPVMPPRAQGLDMLRHGADADEQIRLAREIVEAQPGAPEPLRVALRLAASNLAALRAELEIASAALHEDVRYLGTQVRQHLAAAGAELDRIERATAEDEGLSPHGCTVLPDPPAGCPLRKEVVHVP